MNDAEIVSLFFKRSENAIAELSKKYGRLCTHICRNILNDAQESEECVNETYYAVWKNVPPEKPEPLKAYVCKIARNIALKRFRNSHAKKRDSSFSICLEEIEETVFDDFTLDREIEINFLTELINAFIAGLNKTDRSIIVMRFWYSESYDYIAEKTGLSKSAVYTRMSRLKSQLKKYLIEKGVTER